MDNIQDHIFMGHDGTNMDRNIEFYFSKYFDWVFMNNKIVKRKPIPTTCYIKLDFLNKYINDILNIPNEFILVSGCSDYSPTIHFNESYKKIIKLPNLKKWYCENNLSNHPKVYSLTVGLATHTIAQENKILHIRNNIFSCYRIRTSNICGEQYNERIKCLKFIENNKNYIDSYDTLEYNTFLTKISQYKWCFCPLGNGLDNAPKLIECLLLKTIPICKKNPNSYNLYNKYPILWIDNFDTILTDLKYDSNINWDIIMNEFTHKYIYNKIIGGGTLEDIN